MEELGANAFNSRKGTLSTSVMRFGGGCAVRLVVGGTKGVSDRSPVFKGNQTRVALHRNRRKGEQARKSTVNLDRTIVRCIATRD